MYKDADIISFLEENLDVKAAQMSVERLLRVPPAWEAMREPEFLNKALEASGKQALFPSLLAALSLGFHELSDALEGEANTIETPHLAGLQSTAKQALELCRIEREGGALELIEFMQGTALEWQQAFICAWSEFTDHTAIFELVAERQESTLGKLLASALLAYMSAEQAAVEMLAIKPNLAFQFLPWVECERDLHEALKAELSELSDVFQPNRSSAPDRTAKDALILSKLGHLEEAHSTIRTAWDRSSAQTALIADQLAEIAREDHDPVLEAEARQQALDTYPSSTRRSETALSLLHLGRYEEGLKLVREGDSLKENIAAGLIYLAIQDTHSAGKKLNQAAQHCREANYPSERWFIRMAEGLQTLGFQVQAIQVYKQLSSHFPARAEYRAAMAGLLFSIGDYASAIQQARITVALDPHDVQTRELLASAHEMNDEPEAALVHWEQVAEHNVEKSIRFGECALAAGNPELAKSAANRMLEIDPEHVPGLVLIGRALTEAGEYEQAKTILRDVTEHTPEDADAWIAYASSLQAIGESEAAGHALEQALNINPDHATLHMARAKWLKSVGRNAQALDHTRSAVHKHPGNANWQMEHAELLNSLGHHDQARTTLEAITAAEPANWHAAEELAKTLEKLGDHEQALSVVQSAPADLQPDSAYYVGRLLAAAGSSAADYQRSNELLTKAKSNAVDDPDLDYWLGVSELKQAQYQPASKHFLRYLEATKDANQEHYLDAVVNFAEAALQIGEKTLAMTQLEKAKPSFPTSLRLLSTLSKAHAHVGDQQKSLDIAREALELYPDSLDALHIFKQAAERAGEYDAAIDAQRQITSKSPDDPAAWLDMARINKQRGELSASRSALAKAITLGRNDAGLLSKTAEYAQELQASTLQILLLKRAVSLQEDNDEYLVKLAKAADQSGDFETAANTWLECAGRNPKSIDVLLPAAMSLWKLDRRTAAVGLLQQSTVVAPASPEAHFELGQALVKMNESERGLNQITKAVSLDPDNSVLRSKAASLLAKYSSPSDGISILDGSPTAGKFPDIAEARAECCWLNGQPQEALQAMQAIPAAVPLTIKGAALNTLISIHADDVHAAQETFDQIDPKHISTSTDLEWALLAGFALQDVDRLLAILNQVENQELVNSEMALIALQTCIQHQNLDWIRSKLANSSPSIVQSELEKNTFENLLSLVIQSGLPESVISTSRVIRDLISGNLRADDADLPAQPTGFSTAFIQQCHAIALLRANRPLKAIELLNELPSEPVNRSFSALICGLAQTSSEQFTAAQKSFKIASDLITFRPLANFFEAQMWEKAGSYDQAISSLNAAITINPNAAEWHMNLASLYQKKNMEDAALPHLQQAAELAPESGEILVELARAYTSNGQMVEAEEMYARGLQANPATPGIWKEAGQVALTGGDSERAHAWFERACSLLPDDASCLIGSALAAQRLGNSKQAIERARKAYSLAPENAYVLSGLADILAENGSLDKAIQIYDRAMRVSEQNPMIQLSRSKLLLEADRPKESIADLEQIVASNPDHHEAWIVLARAYAVSNEYDEALTAAQQAASIAPRNRDYRLLTAKLCRQSGQLDQALDILVELQQEAPDWGAAAREKGIVHEERNELELAIDAYNRALAIDSHDAETVINAGLLLKQLKAYEESAELLERGTELRPNDANLHQQLAAVRALQFVHGHRIEEQVVAS